MQVGSRRIGQGGDESIGWLSSLLARTHKARISDGVLATNREARVVQRAARARDESGEHSHKTAGAPIEAPEFVSARHVDAARKRNESPASLLAEWSLLHVATVLPKGGGSAVVPSDRLPIVPTDRRAASASTGWGGRMRVIARPEEVSSREAATNFSTDAASCTVIARLTGRNRFTSGGT